MPGGNPAFNVSAGTRFNHAHSCNVAFVCLDNSRNTLNIVLTNISQKDPPPSCEQRFKKSPLYISIYISTFNSSLPRTFPHLPREGSRISGTRRSTSKWRTTGPGRRCVPGAPESNRARPGVYISRVRHRSCR